MSPLVFYRKGSSVSQKITLPVSYIELECLYSDGRSWYFDNTAEMKQYGLPVSAAEARFKLWEGTMHTLCLFDDIAIAIDPDEMTPELEADVFDAVYKGSSESCHIFTLCETGRDVQLYREFAKRPRFIPVGAACRLLACEGYFFAAETPESAELRVVSVQPPLRGESRCTLETGDTVYVPAGICPGDIVLVDTAARRGCKKS